MIYVLMALIAISLLLMIISFFMRDKVKTVQEEVEQLSLTHMQEMYQLKKKLKLLEEELLIEEEQLPPSVSSSIYSQTHSKSETSEIIKIQVVSLFNQGLSLPQIARQSSLSVSDVGDILYEKGLR